MLHVGDGFVTSSLVKTFGCRRLKPLLVQLPVCLRIDEAVQNEILSCDGEMSDAMLLFGERLKSDMFLSHRMCRVFLVASYEREK